MGRPAKPLDVSAEDRLQLESMARSQSLPAALSRRAQMILCMAHGETNSAIARRYRYSWTSPEKVEEAANALRATRAR